MRPMISPVSDQVRQDIPWNLIFGIWTGYGIVASLQQTALLVYNGRPVHVWTGLALQLPSAWCWALLTPFVWGVARRLPLAGPDQLLRVMAHFLIGAAIVFSLDVVFELYAPLIIQAAAPHKPLLARASKQFVWLFLGDSMLYWAVLIVGQARAAAARSRARELRQAQLESQLAQAQLVALKMQLHPHFLFNALHTVATLVRTGSGGKAVQVVARLGDLLRRMLDDALTQQVTLGEEMQFIRAYLEIEQIRFEDRLVVVSTTPPDTLAAQVPHLILEPLVENAIRHGIASNEAGQLEISARHVGAELRLTVRDSGVGLEARANASPGRGVGLANTRLRLLQLYGDRATLMLSNNPTRGVTAEIRLPFQVVPSECRSEREGS